MNSRIIGLIASIIVMTVISVFLIRTYAQQHYACPTIRRSAPLSIPAYPNAQQEHPIIQPEDGGNVQHIGFQTNDSPQTIIAFYKERLAKEGWLLAERTDDSFFRFGQTEAVPLYSLDVEVTPTARNGTAVRVRLWSGPCVRA
jgi:hypothetical protein